MFPKPCLASLSAAVLERNEWRRVARTALAFLAVAASLLLTVAQPASADSWVSGCNWAGVSGYGPGACVRATTGGKNYGNHTQWVGLVQAYRSGLGSASIVKVESWGDGFYYAASGSSAQWAPQRWVRSGTNVCSAVTYSGGARYVACIAISV
jgi:hypothetical protein